MQIIKTTCLLILFIVLGGCMTEVDVTKENANLLKTDKEFAAKSQEVGPAEAFYLYMDNEGIQLPIHGNPIIGKQSIRERMLSAGEYQLNWTPKKAEVSKSADMGWTWGTYIYQAKDENGENIQRQGKYLNVWKKQSDGSWKVAVDIGNIEPQEE